MDKPVKAQELDLEIESLAFGGRGVARVDGFVLFVDGAVPGDRVRAVVTRAKRSYAEARTIQVLKPSAGRIEPACAHFGDCGGCSWQSLEYGKQLEFKQRQVSECLGHIGGASGYREDPPLGAPRQWRYRNKVEFSFASNRDGRLDLGFHRPGDWRQVVDIEDCHLHSALTNRIRNHVRDFARSTGLGAYEQRSESGFWRHLVLREGMNTGQVMVNAVTAAGDFPRRDEFTSSLTARFPEIVSIIHTVNDTRASVATGFPYSVLFGKDHFKEELCGLKLRVSPASFLQTNTAMAEKLYLKALEYAELEGGEHVYDLYCGLGSITLLLARHCGSVFGVEIVEEAVDLAAANAEANGVGNATFAAGKVRRVLKELDDEKKPDLVVLDPPRAGASRKEIQRLAELGASRLVYVSCNASTLAGNASQLAEAGYELTRVGAVDMFPQTPHIEAVARFDLRS